MILPWPDLVADFAEFRRMMPEPPFALALEGIQSVAASIAGGPLNACLFGWTSMHDLCIQQTAAQPYTAPYLRIAPQRSGMVEFRYNDTAKAERQWHREVPPGAAVARFESFLDQLRWVARVSPG